MLYVSGYFRIIASLVIIPFVVIPVVNSKLSQATKDRIYSMVEMTRSCYHMPGIALSIVSRTEGRLVEKCFGYEDVFRKTKVTERTLFPIGSTTKAFTSSLLAILMQKHSNLTTRFRWSTTLKTLLGDWFVLNNPVLTCHTTLQDILAHKTGIQDYFLLFLAGYPKNFTKKQFVETLRYHKPEAPFRTEMLYNNHIYAIAGLVAETLERRPWEDLLRDLILKPLGMNDTRLVRENLESTPSNLARSYVYLNDSFIPVDLKVLEQTHMAGPAGAIVSSVHDMSTWMLFHLNGGRTPSGLSIVSSDLLQETYKENLGSAREQTDLMKPGEPVQDVHVAYNLGWITNYYRGHKRIWHSGSVSTYKSQLWLYPDSGYGIFATISGPQLNKTSAGLNRIMRYVSDILLNVHASINGAHTPPPNDTLVCGVNDEPSGARNGRETTGISDPLPRPVSDYVGVYGNEIFGSVIISFNKTEKLLTLSMGLLLTANLFYNRSEDVFYAAFTGLMWYHTSRLPVRFTCAGRRDVTANDADIISLLEIPLTMGPLNTAHSAHFSKGAEFKNELNQFDSCACVAATQIYHSSGFLLVLVMIGLYLF